MSLPDPFALPSGDIPTEPLPDVRRAPGLVHPELRPGIPTEPEIGDYYRASLADTAAAGPGAPGGPAPSGDGCCD